VNGRITWRAVLAVALVLAAIAIPYALSGGMFGPVG
jgi:hypothetical protein